MRRKTKRKIALIILFIAIILELYYKFPELLSYTTTLFTEDVAKQDDFENKLIKVPLVRVVDGDTIIVKYNQEERRVRLIGIDTPESVATQEYLEKSGKENTEEGKTASDYTKMLLEQVPSVYLQFDISECDQYDRLLCYVWLTEDTSDLYNMLNYRLVYDGYAINKEFAPDLSHAEDFTYAFSDAKANKRGLHEYYYW